jgi:hypothetical protein
MSLVPPDRQESQRDEPMPGPKRDRLRSARRPKLIEDRGHVKLHRIARNSEMGGDRPITHTLCDHLEDLKFPRGQNHLCDRAQWSRSRQCTPAEPSRGLALMPKTARPACSTAAASSFERVSKLSIGPSFEFEIPPAACRPKTGNGIARMGRVHKRSLRSGLSHALCRQLLEQSAFGSSA